MNSKELDQNLARFYVEARTKKGEEYSRSALLGFRNSLTAELQFTRKMESEFTSVLLFISIT